MAAVCMYVCIFTVKSLDMNLELEINNILETRKCGLCKKCNIVVAQLQGIYLNGNRFNPMLS